MTDNGKNRLLGTLGLAARARKTVTGTDGVCTALKDGKAFAVVTASDISDNTRKRLSDKCAFYGVTLIDAGVTQDRLGTALGKQSLTAAAAVCDRSLADAVISVYGSEQNKQ